MDSFSQPFAQMARVKNISNGGAVVCGITSRVAVGEILEVQLNQEKAQYQVVWIGAPGSRKQGEIGLARLAAEPYLFEVDRAYMGAAAGRG